MKAGRLATLVVLVAFAGCTTQLQHGLDERDANEVVSALLARGFDAKKVAEKGRKPTWAVELPEASAAEALQVLAELKLPRPPRLKTLALAQQASLVDTPSAERLRYLEAQEGDLEEALEAMDGVATVAVELVVPPPPRPGAAPLPSRASVLVRAHPEAMERLQAQRAELRALVAGAVEGLRGDDVVLVLDAVALSPGAPPAPARSASRSLGAAVGVVASLLAAGLLFSWLRLRQVGDAGDAREAPVPPARPVINPAVQRRAA